MRRHVKIIHRAEARIVPLMRRIESAPVSQWPEHLKRAWEILQESSKTTEKSARAVVLELMAAAQVCAEAINRQSDDLVEGNTREKLCGAFKRLANCCRRAPAKLRKRLDGTIGPMVQHGFVDAELVEDILDATAIEFAKSPNEKAAATALRTMFVAMPDREPSNWIKSAYGGLCSESQRNAEAALLNLRNQQKGLTAAAVFDALASALKVNPVRKTDLKVSKLICDYVSETASIWRVAGLNPGRAFDPADATYKSKFHRFADLILTALAEPWTQRHAGNLDDLRERLYRAQKKLEMAQKKLPPEVRISVSGALRPCDQGWLISDHILKQALRTKAAEGSSLT